MERSHHQPRLPRGVSWRTIRETFVVALGFLLVGCDLARGPAHREVDLIEARTQLDSLPKVIVPPRALSLDYDVSTLCVMLPTGYREDGLRWAILDPAGDTIRVRADLRLSDGRVLATGFAYFVVGIGGDYYCLSPGATPAEYDSIRAGHPAETIASLRVWSNYPIVVRRLQWRAMDAP